MKLLSGAFGQTLASELLPTLQGMADLWLENKEKGDQFRGVATTIADGHPVDWESLIAEHPELEAELTLLRVLQRLETASSLSANRDREGDHG